MRRGGALIGLMLLAACSGGAEREPYVQSRTPANLAERFYPPEGWAWGLVQVGDAPPQRYGVSAPATTPWAQILILPDYGETAETWFETASNLNDRGYTVWVLDAAGQGGSGRLARPRDLGHADSFAPDIAAVRAIAKVIIRPGATSPLFILGHGVGAVTAARAAETGAPTAGLILSAPAFSQQAGAEVTAYHLFGLGRRRLPGTTGWRRDDEKVGLDLDPWRAGVTHAWQTANPDLRMGGPSLDWAAAYDLAASEARRDFKSVDAETLVVAAAPDCAALPHCSAVAIAAGPRALELARNEPRDAWLAAIDTFIRQQLAPPTPDASQPGAAPIASRQP